MYWQPFIKYLEKYNWDIRVSHGTIKSKILNSTEEN